MKKFLYGTTALFAVGLLAQPASAAEKIQLKLGGFMTQFVGYASQKGSFEDATGKRVKFDQQSDTEVYFTGSTKLDNGITVSVIMQAEADENQSNGKGFDETYLKLTSDTIGDLRLGGRKAADWAFGFFAPDAGKVGVDSGYWDNWVVVPAGFDYYDTTRLTGVADKNSVVYYSPRFGGFGIGLSYMPDSKNSINGNNATTTYGAASGPLTYTTGANVGHSIYEAGAVFERDFNGVGVHANFFWGQQVYGAPAYKSDLNEWKAGALVTYAGFKVGGAYRKVKDHAPANANVNSGTGHAWNLGVEYGVGPYSVSAGYHTSSVEHRTDLSANDVTKMAMASAGYVLGPGVKASASLFWVKYDSEQTDPALNNSGIGAVAGLALNF